MSREDAILRHEQIIYPTVRVVGYEDGGSGTVIYSRKCSGGEVVTMVLTNHHVIDECIEVVEKWDSFTSTDRKKEYTKTARVDFFKYNRISHCIGSFSVESDIVAYDDNQDMALLETRDRESPASYVATLFPIENTDEILITDPVWAVGASLGHAPIPSAGYMSFMNDEIENNEYWLTSAPNIYGNSGGGIYRYSEERAQYEYIGVPSIIRVVPGFTKDAIPHMSNFIPITRIIEFLDEHCYQFIYDDSCTIEECAAARKLKKEQAQMQADAQLGLVSRR